jgi:nicotinate dehydrogenase subunit B
MGYRITVNGVSHVVSADPRRSLLDVLREDLGLTGAKYGCGEGACGACTVLLGRRAVAACSTPAAEAASQRVTTVEGLAEDGILHPVQQAWLEVGAMQCGYCTPGWLMATAALLDRVAQPGDDTIRAALAGNVCRCCAYPRILAAVHRAAELMDRPEELKPVPAPEAGWPAAAAASSPAPSDRAAPPWDLSGHDASAFFSDAPGAGLAEGLVTVVAGDGPARGWADPGDAWVHVGADGMVTAFTGKVEAGQGTRAALALLVAEELAVDVAAVRVVMGNTSVSPFDLGTFGSRAMPLATPALRAAAAGARDLLREAAAQRFGLPAAQLTAGGGMVAGPDGAPAVSYGELVAGQRRVERVPRDQPVTPPARWRQAGLAGQAGGASWRSQRVRVPGSADVVTGAKRFPADTRVEGMLEGCVLRPPAYGAALRSASTAAAEALPGVTVVREGDFIGAVSADRATARRAIEAVDASWAIPPHPSRAGLAGYLRAHPAPGGEGILAPFRHEQGDVDAALARSPVRLAAHYATAYIAHVPMEPRSAVAWWAGDRLTVWTGTSTPFRARRELADALALEQEQVQVVVPDYGGGFGGKHGSAVALEAARLARAAGRPVRVQWNRHEEFCWGYFRPAALIDIESGLSESGEITGWSFTNINSGSPGIATPYRIGHQRIVYQPAHSPLPQGSYRALAATANHFARESHMDDLAGEAGADPVEFRLRHLDDDRLAAVLRAAADHADRWRAGAHAAPLPRTGVGIACGIEKGGRVATAAQVSVAPDGTLRVLRLVTAFDCGAVVNPDSLISQIEGAAMMGLGGALFEEIDFADGRVLNASMSRYRVPRLTDLPEIEVVLADQPAQPPAGGGETPIVAIAPAIGNAIFDACGIRLTAMPLAPRGVIDDV